MKNILIILMSFMTFTAMAQHTFSIVAIDSVTGEIGSAGATCGDSILWPGTPGALIISDIIPGLGAIHAQSYWVAANQNNAHNQMLAGLSPDSLITWLATHDVQNNPNIRQYGIVDFNAGHPRSAGYTGSSCLNYKNHITGSGYSIQGNILLGQQILDSMEARYLNTPGPIALKLMAALQGAKVIGADTRCTQYNTSSLSAFIRVAKPGDTPDSLYLHLNVAAVWPAGPDPIDVLQNKFNTWFTAGIGEYNYPGADIKVFPNPSEGRISLQFPDYLPSPDRLTIITPDGRIIRETKLQDESRQEVNMEGTTKGLYILQFYIGASMVGNQKLVICK